MLMLEPLAPQPALSINLFTFKLPSLSRRKAFNPSSPTFLDDGRAAKLSVLCLSRVRVLARIRPGYGGNLWFWIRLGMLIWS